MEPRGNKLIARYKKTYSIPAEVTITEQMILDHWKLEKQLTSELLRSTPGDRWQTFNRCYTRLYSELGWLNQFSNLADPRSPQERFGGWLDLIGPPPKSIYEIGSGQGGLISFLALNGYDCKGTEITGERGEKLLPGTYANPSWGMSDGVHLDRFEPAETYDVVVSDQVIEHLHPDDLESHLTSARSILKKGGRYIFNTPNKYTGPHDVSRVFKRGEPAGMHLKEYTCRELFEAATRAGFADVRYGFVPRRFRIMLAALGIGRFAKPETVGSLFLRFVFLVERFLATLPAPGFRRLCATICCQIGVFSGTVSLIAKK
ncbi:SAM-dependent methyltransferase [Mycobacterium sp. E342]|uniref:class I SAM-dependent methyltransferase n=1 Tax=Mycobacterium sp. E342 TaxID=1834147 RepID=UPI0007FD329D|nr:class I SAM-dependent methyltransferase [Mycobacterium sp. E342]OBH31739.1 SAM-dependent methyltransferase [Mycobacterium sp. E342]